MKRPLIVLKVRFQPIVCQYTCVSEKCISNKFMNSFVKITSVLHCSRCLKLLAVFTGATDMLVAILFAILLHVPTASYGEQNGNIKELNLKSESFPPFYMQFPTD